MNRGFYTIMIAQFFSSLADNALLIAAIALLVEMDAPEWMTPLLKLFFVLSYVLLAAFVGAFADAIPKGRVMFVTNLIKIVGCGMFFLEIHPLIAYAIVGLGAAAYSPAKYGILTELLPPEKLVTANGWIETLTIISIILGTVIGGILINPKVVSTLLQLSIPIIRWRLPTPTQVALTVIMMLYLLAAMFNLKIPDTGVRYASQEYHPFKLIANFSKYYVRLWKDKLGQIPLAVTTLFWGASATLQFIVLKWAEQSLRMSLDKAAILQAVVGLGVAVGATIAARWIPLKKSLTVLPAGVAMGCAIMGVVFMRHLWVAIPSLVLIGILAGYFVVPMNALLQHRGHVLMSAGHSIAVQNFNENLSILAMLSLYAALIKMDTPIHMVILFFGVFVTGIMLFVIKRHTANQKVFDVTTLIGMTKSLPQDH